MSGVYNLRFDDGQRWRVTTSAVESFRDLCLTWMPKSRTFSDRISLCLWFDLLVMSERYGVLPQDVLQPILDLEGAEPTTGLKPATRFNGPLLKGLWHKHWFNARFLPANLLTAMDRGNPLKWISEIVGEDEILTEETLNRIAERLTTTSYEERHSAKQVTGEWIIFLKRGGVNYYLCLGTHLTGDQRIYEKIASVCSRDYPDVVQWIAEAASKPSRGPKKN